MWEVASALASLLTAGVTCVAVLYAAVQWRDARREAYDRSRPIVVPRYVVQTQPDRRSGGEFKGVWIEVSNFGLTPARNVVLTFPDGVIWNVGRNTTFPFLAEHGGISVLTPGQTLRYYVGPLKVGSHLQRERKNSFSVHVEYSAPFAGGGAGKDFEVSESHLMTLRDYIGTGVMRVGSIPAAGSAPPCGDDSAERAVDAAITPR